MRIHAATALLLVAAATACSGSSEPSAESAPKPSSSASSTPTTLAATQPPGDLPRVLVAIGDSITAGVNPDRETIGADPTVSWSTGDDPADEVLSHLERLQAAGAVVTADNVAEPGAQVVDGPAQAAQAVTARADYVTVLLGANDACRGPAITPVNVFADAVNETLQTIVDGRPEARILLASVPDVTRLWSLAGGNPDARAVWDAFEVCRGVLTGTATEATRTRVRAQIVAYNGVLQQSCERRPQCRYDGGAVFERSYEAADVSPLDFFHPSTRGQARLAEATWQASWWTR